MDDPERQNESGDDTNAGESHLLPDGFLDIGRKFKHQNAKSAENQQVGQSEKTDVAQSTDRKGIGVDRIIELCLTAAITFFALVQWVTSCSNNSSTSRQTDQLIQASRYSAYAADRNALAAQSFAVSADKINNGVRDAVGRLNTQAIEMSNLVDAAQQQAIEARNYIAVAQKIADEDRRPWVSISNVACANCVGTSEETVTNTTKDSFLMGKLSLILVNTGKTPAIDVDFRYVNAEGIESDAIPTYDSVMEKFNAPWTARRETRPTEIPRS
jgi:hypothetical protein